MFIGSRNIEDDTMLHTFIKQIDEFIVNIKLD